MFFSSGFVRVASGKSNGRSFMDDLSEGRVTISGLNHDGQRVKRVVKFHDNEIWDNAFNVNGKRIFRIVYGQFVKDRERWIRFHPKTGQGKHGKARARDMLFGHKGICHSWFKRGRLIRQKFYYENGVKAYDWSLKKVAVIRDVNGVELFRIEGALSAKEIWDGRSIFTRPMDVWFRESEPFCVWKRGKVFYRGHVQNGQRVGEWVIDGKKFFYEHGVAIPEKLYHASPESLDPIEILKIGNTQLRMALMAKVGTERLATVGKVIHQDGSMRLYDIPKCETRILRVKCPSTNSFYFLGVPKDATRCEQARQWTFHVGDGFERQIRFVKET